VTSPPLRQGDFAWCAFPEREAPLRPGPLHVVYVLAVATVSGRYAAMVAYTTSQPSSDPLPPGVLAFTAAEAALLGQTRPFVMDLRRLAYLPLTTLWFPGLDRTDGGILARAPKALRNQINATATELARRRPEVLSRAGPLWRSPS